MWRPSPRLMPRATPLPGNIPLDFEDPHGPIYTITITATDDGTPSMSSTLEVTITVTDANDRGSIGIITGIAQVGQTLTAGTVTDQDGLVADSSTWQWQADRTDISGATSETYQLTATEEDKTIRVIVTYTDSLDSGQMVTSRETRAVVSEDAPAPPSIALDGDTGSSDTDRITNNGQVNVVVVDGATWKYSTNFGRGFTDGSGTSFTLDNNRYSTAQVQAVQTVGGVDSAAADLGPVTVDTIAPVIIHEGDLTLALGDTYNDQDALAADNFALIPLETTITFDGAMVETVDTNIVGTYTIIYNAQDVAGNDAEPITRLIIVVEISDLISDLDGESGVSIKDAKLLYYARALDLAPEDSATLARISHT